MSNSVLGIDVSRRLQDSEPKSEFLSEYADAFSKHTEIKTHDVSEIGKDDDMKAIDANKSKNVVKTTEDVAIDSSDLNCSPDSLQYSK